MLVRDDVPTAASRVADDGTTERAAFVGADGERIFTCLYLPAGAPRASVVICPPLHGEFMRNYRREVLLARELVRAGFAVERFHYRYTGNSDGDGAHLTFDSMREDALGRIEHVRSESGAAELFLVGTRWGGLIAASAAAQHPGASIVLWAPLMDAAGFFREAFRSSLVRERSEGSEQPTTRAALEAELDAGRAIDAVASTIEPAMYRSSKGRAVESELGSSPRAVLMMQIGPTGTVRPDLARQTERWRALGWTVDVEPVKGEESWWLIDERWHDEAKRPMTVQLIDRTVGWIEDRAEQGRDA